MGFTNWSENIKNSNVKIYYPRLDTEIIDLIAKAKSDSKIVRVVGAGHSQSPAVCNRDEKIMLISLRDYHLTPEDFSVDHRKMTITVNPGWTLGRLYDELNHYRLFIDTQTASSAFTVGGVVSMPVHGCRLGASFISDSITALILIDSHGNIVRKSDQDSDFDIYRINLGVMGIVISVTLRVHRIDGVKTSINCVRNVFDSEGKIDRSLLDAKYSEVIKACYEDKIKYHHTFLDMHNNKIIMLDWEPGHEPSLCIDFAESQEIPKLEIYRKIHENLIPNYRQNRPYLRFLGTLLTTTIVLSVKLNSLEDQDMFWVYFGSPLYFMSYFIPIHQEGEPIDLSKLYSALEIIMEQVKAANRFNIDFPVDIRFVCSSRSAASPLRAANGKRMVYLAVEVLCLTTNLKVESSNKTSLIPCNPFSNGIEEWKDFFSVIEQHWISLGGIPHYAKMFGFSDSASIRPFDPDTVGRIFSPEVKAKLKPYAQPLFLNSFVNQLLN